VVLFDAAPHILPGVLDAEMASAVEAYLKSEEVEIHTNCPVEGISESEAGVTVTAGRVTVEADRALVAVGVRPDSRLAADCGLALGRAGGIVVDDRMRTSDPDIYAAGDCVEVKHLISGKSLQLPLGSIANRQGRLVGTNLGGGDQRFGPVVGTVAVKVFDMNVAATGLTEASGREAGYNVGCAWGTFTDKADYYPEAQNIHYKLVFDKDSRRVLGLQDYGKGEVVKNVDTLAVHLKNGAHLEDLMEIESAYAPPYAPALNHVYSLGCIAMDTLLEDVPAISPEDPYGDKIILDVRDAKEIKAMPLSREDVLIIPFEQIRERWEEIPKDRPLAIICAKGVRSAETVRFLREKGFSDLAYYGGGRHMRPSG
jgi:pyruvate/2-oxoglutarate dehydrogenase complex dihydrolipoamide dehydrogenase (E3) component/rhodanese-related sulfurtransferase